MKNHLYKLEIEWTGNNGSNTKTYDAYRRDFTIHLENKSPIFASADSIFRGDPGKLNPEEMLLSALSSCHMLWFLHECADHGVLVKEYIDRVEGNLIIIPGKGGRFDSATLTPSITFENNPENISIDQLHQLASEKCFIANSCNFPVLINSKNTFL